MSNFHRPRRIEEEYRRALNALMESWLRVFPHNPSLEEIFSFLGNGGGERVMKASDSLARRMVTQVAVQNAQSWREAAAKSSQGKRIYDLLRNEMAGSVGAAMRQMVASHAALIRSMPDRMAQDLASQIATRQMRGERAETIAKDIAKRFPHITRAHTAMLARTEVSSAATSISEARAEHLNLPCYEWLSSEDRRVRPAHKIMDHVICFWSDPPAPEALDGIRSTLGHYHAGRAPNCFPGNTGVNLSNGCKDVWRVPYDGQIIDFMISGNLVSVTPNHPILTPDGTWKPAYLFNEDDYFIQAIGETPLIIDENKNKRLPTFEELFGAFRELAQESSPLEFDFYGDMANGNVDHVSLAEFLTNDGPSLSNERIGDFTLSDSDSMTNSANRILSHIGDTRLAGDSNQSVALFSGHAAHAKDVCQRPATALNPITDEQILDTTARTSELFSERQFASSGLIGGNDFIFRQIQAIVRNQPALESPDLTRRVRIIQKRLRHFIGHVYTLQSHSGMYSVTSTGIIARNCRCDANVIVDLDQISFPARVYHDGRIERMSRARFAKLYK